MTSRCIERTLMLSFIKDRLAWLRSFFQRSPVITTHNAAINLSELPSEASFSGIRKPGLARYIPRDGLEFILEGTTRTGDRVVYRLYYPETKKIISLSEETFKLLFKLK